MIDVKKVGLFIAECRKSKNWTQKQLGEKLGVTDRAVSKWETGRSLPDICLIEDICKLFDLQVSELLAGRKIEEEDYKKETEQMLIRTIGENQLYGFQVVLHLLEISALLAFYVPCSGRDPEYDGGECFLLACRGSFNGLYDLSGCKASG